LADGQIDKLKRLIASFDWKKLIEFLTDEVFVESIY
jgi:hypothetical protein